ncbi:hypothetical protein [Micromonospora sp. CPCC 206061]|uniref:hypothetical protein n=1 Tax=Micromonospora sp. CPCC 206061 TaxID=3122410 RepID=UPI002FF35468
MGSTGLPRAEGERLIGALVPLKVTRPTGRAPAPLPALPRLSLPTDTDPDGLVLGMARLDRSGRLSARELLGVLGWRPGHRVDIGVVAGVLVIASATAGLHVVRGRGELSVPAAARRMCGLPRGVPVLLVASPAQAVLVIHPVKVVAGLLAAYHTELVDGDHG